MSKRNSLEEKRNRRKLREAKDELNKESLNAQPSAKYGVCSVTGKYTIVDHEHNISQPAWFEIIKWKEKVEK